MKKYNKKGISLILIIITMLVMLILASAIIMLFSDNNPIKQALKLSFKNDLTNFTNELNTYNYNQIMDGPKGYTPLKLQADENSVTYDGIEDTNKTINNIITLLGSMSKYDGLFEVSEGKLVYKGTDTTQQEWAEEIGLEVIIQGEPQVTIIAISETAVEQGIDIVYTIEFSSNAGLSDINLTDKVQVVRDDEKVLTVQPDFVIGTVSGTELDYTRSVDVTIETDALLNGSYKLIIKAGSATNENDISNMKDTTCLTSFNIEDNTAPTNPIILANPTEWTNGNVVVTITYSPDSLAKKYSTNGINWSNYTTYITVNTNNTTVYAKSIDQAGNQSGQSTLTIANIDVILPTVDYGTNGGESDIASTTVTVSDVGGSLINTSTLQYVWDSQNTVTPSVGWTSFTNGATLTKTDVGTYYLWIKSSDNAGNTVVSKTNSFTLVPDYVESEGVNKPVLSAGMTAIKWNGSSWDTVSSPNTDTTWYDYGNKEWANAQTVDASMWVWIPRYEYQIPTPHSSTAQTIAVNFLRNKSTTATSGYTVHPAFTFGAVELTGIWIAKFEVSGSISAIDVKPNVTSLRSLNIDAMFTACRNMETTYGTKYGWGTSGTGIDTHLMKNMEWGACAYISQSIYGKNSEVWKNPNSNYLTGQAGESVSCLSTTVTYPYNDMTYGVNASTTGNIYGVYDMSGGAYEFAAAYINNGDANLTTYGSSLVNATSQYKDAYSVGTSDTENENYIATSSKKGDAIYETSSSCIGSTSWYSDNSYMPCLSSPFFLHGGTTSNNTSAGTFNFHNDIGIAYSNIGFRPVLAVSSEL
ncbi:MAG: hypothetical protein PHD15_03830 [Clostridia bacterium]|nr:hypothetical protein [Clostridia bacterium]MDD4386871.1 hypothetical protein [Clostridia bacterium]